jgi:hypothetical protein
MSKILKQAFNKYFRDEKGNIIIWRFPNIPLWCWIVLTLGSMILNHGKIHEGLHLLAQAFLFTWAYMELHSGESIFRRTLGAAVLISIVVSFFK